ncbi:unnamed protein product [Alopecurus aequalis]
MATAAAALRLLRRRAAAPASLMLRPLLPGPHSKAAAALSTVSRVHVSSPLAQPYLLRRYSSKGFDGTAAADITGTRRMNEGIDSTAANDIIPRLAKQSVRARKAAGTCQKASLMFRDDPDKACAMWEEGWDELSRSAAVYRNCIDSFATATASLKESPLDLTPEQTGDFFEVMEDYARTAREFCTTLEDFISTSRNDMKKLSRGREELKTLQMIAKGLVTLTLGISLLALLTFMGIHLAF